MKNLLYALIADRVRGLQNIDRTNHLIKRQRDTERTVAAYELALEILGPWADDLTECYPVKDAYHHRSVEFPLPELHAFIQVERIDTTTARVTVGTHINGRRSFFDGFHVHTAASDIDATRYNPERCRKAIENQLADYAHANNLFPSVQS